MPFKDYIPGHIQLCSDLLSLCSIFESNFPAGSSVTEFPPAILEGGDTMPYGLGGELSAGLQLCSFLAHCLEMWVAS